MESISSTPVTSTAGRGWSSKCVQGGYWDLDFRQYGPDKMIYPSHYLKWADYIRNMEVREDDVWIVTFPKCGTTWCQEMVWLICNDLDFNMAKDKILFERSPFLDIDAMFRIPSKWNATDETNKPPTSMELVAGMPSPRIIKTHLPLSLLPSQLMEKRPKIVYVARHPKDACVSYYHHSVLIPGYTGTLVDFVESFVTDNVVYSPYWANVKAFYELRNEPNILFLTYEEMKADLKSVLLKTAEWFGKQLNAQQISKLLEHLSFESMKSNPSVNWEPVIKDAFTIHKTPAKTGFMRKGKVGSWKEEMSEESVKKFDKWMARNSIPGLYS